MMEEHKKQTSTHFSNYTSYNKLFNIKKKNKTLQWLGVCGFIFILFLLLPWTQNIQTAGFVTALNPAQKPQSIYASISGAIKKWHVQDGQFVKKGDTILVLKEIKPEYLDPKLLEQTSKQLEGKSAALENYEQKLGSNSIQIEALEASKTLKLSQLKNKILQTRLYISSDSATLVATEIELDIAKKQFERQQELYNQGLISLTDLERRKQAFQTVNAKYTSAQNKLNVAIQENINAQIEYQNTERDYAEKIAKIQSDYFTTASMIQNGKVDLSKLENTYTNYSMRNDFYVITAPQDGQVTNISKSGIGEIIKEGEVLLKIVPFSEDKAIEIYVDPVDQPLVHEGEIVNIQFDGYPTIVFSGWPSASYGLFQGKINAIDKTVNETGKFRVLVTPDHSKKTWPSKLRYGNGSKAMILLKDVAIGYEIWRKLNAFPPEYYTPQTTKSEKKK